MLNITRHEVVKDSKGNFIKLIVGIVYTDANGKSTYRDMIFLASDFSANPTKLEVKDKFKQWLTNINEKGTSVLQTMKEETQDKGITITFKQGNPASLIGDTINEN